ncbi:uncharacterized protein N0V89_011329 [Didymosphaeria variabile]|uniref:Xylanolytic transcriptional activator regulatory domain-containing protein n=1 Tax=Didymosphaeria variabile TaxID=1932322 RepID=A0A9W8X9K2_9PLEO|nr:uncharacterized protein N0V89_011329 [Didymosphaeria variabile]KAJ4345200.1 hypothetical protein N0V89_011329 [Didymosphaeria variabile]
MMPVVTVETVRPTDAAALNGSRPLVARNAHSSSFSLHATPGPHLSDLVSSDSAGFVDIFGYSSTPPKPLVEPAMPSSLRGAHLADPDSLLVSERASNSPLGGPIVSTYRDMSPVFGVFRQDVMPANNEVLGRNMRLNEPHAQSVESVRIYELVTQLTNTFITLPKGHHAKASSSRIDQADTFFTVSNVTSFIQTYFHHFHPHFTIIHRPSFDLKTVSPRLLVAVCLAGSLYMSTLHDIGRGKSFLDLAEEFIFRDTLLRRAARGRPFNEGTNNVANDSAVACASSLQTMQAALIIVLLQNWEGNLAAQRRARSDGVQQLISLARASRLNSFKVSWPKPGESLENFDWAEFGRQEACTRTLYHLYTFDSTLCIIYNYPPKFALAEMGASLPCPGEFFEATSRAECLQSEGFADYHEQPFWSLKEVYPLLLGDDVPADAKSRLVRLTPVHLFILVHTIHCLIWHSKHTSIRSPATISVIERAISRWKNLWDWSKGRVPARWWRSLGFVQHADEYRWLAQIKLHEGVSEEELVFEDDHKRGVRQLLGQFRAVQSADDVDFDV